MPNPCLSLCIVFLLLMLMFPQTRFGGSGRAETYISKKLPAFVINRDSRPDRMHRFLSQKGLNGLNIIRIPATELPQDEMPPDMKLTRGELGCFKSHVRTWKRMVEERIPEALVFEDDANLHGQSIIADVEACRSQLPTGWHVVFLGLNYFQKENDVNACFIKQKEGSYGAHCYIISLQGAARILRSAEREGFTMPVDIFLSSGACDCRYYLLRGNKVKPFDLSDTDTQRLR
jgi:GR25 family glycosyltransferase involved in LPS biosynthesis